jgi:glycerol-3-phosphate dehydrogenase (NAD(P)+)
MAEVTILGAGAWGTALAVLLTNNGHRTVLCVRRHEQLEAMRARRENAAHLPGVALPAELELAEDWATAVGDATTVVMAVPSQYARATIEPIIGAIAASTIIVSVTKGIEQNSLCTMTQMIAGLAPPAERVAVLSGPGFAAEVARGQPGAIVAAANRDEVAARVQSMFATKALRVYRSSDVIGVELGGAAKNVIAIAAGVSDGIGLGSGARAALITRGLAEMMRLAAAAGAKRETMAGLAGLGDLVLTCAGDSSRNRSLGLRLGRGEARAESASDGPVAEGVANAKSIKMLAARLGVDMPITSAVYRLLYEAVPANAMVEELLNRELKAEF